MVALSTFNNLPEHRKLEIIQAALREFCLFDYHNASLSRIVQNLNLAKGSFYRYFENKRSLYFFLLHHCSEVRLEHDKKNALLKNDLFENILEHFRTKILFDKEFPLESAFIYTVLREANNDEIGDIFFISRNEILKHIHPLVLACKERSVLRNDISSEAISFSIMNSMHSILDFISLKYTVDHKKNIQEGKPLYPLSIEEMMKEATAFVDLLKNGIQIQLP
jgi:TetR/AcrR family transcriptional regulator